jgi:DNA polymerase
MSDPYTQLLDATLEYLEDLKAQGVKYLNVLPENLAALAAAPRPGATLRSSASQPEPAASRPLLPTANADPPRPRPPIHTPASLAPLLSPLASPAPPPARSDAPAFTPDLLAPPPSASPTAKALSPEAKTAAMAELRTRALACTKCPHLVATRRQVVFGVGDIHSPLMFVGEAPGVDEDIEGEPFVGKAGQLLTRIIQTMGFRRDSVYIGNILKCRPDTPPGTTGNRKPTPDEMKTCLPYLLEQIDLIQPQVIVALGATAMEGLFGRQCFITKERGHWRQFRNIPVMPTYHPSYVLRVGSLGVKREIWEDMLQALEKLGRPISEKQRGYFLREQG